MARSHGTLLGQSWNDTRVFVLPVLADFLLQPDKQTAKQTDEQTAVSAKTAIVLYMPKA